MSEVAVVGRGGEEGCREGQGRQERACRRALERSREQRAESSRGQEYFQSSCSSLGTITPRNKCAKKSRQQL